MNHASESSDQFDLLDLQPWSENDFTILERANSPEQTRHLGGAETHDKLLDRHKRYLENAVPGEIRMFKIVIGTTHEAVGSVGYWEKDWQGEFVYETGWSVLPEYQGHGVASNAMTLLIALLKSGEGQHPYLHAFPSILNVPSNALCKKLGFSLIGEFDFEYPPGNILWGI